MIPFIDLQAQRQRLGGKIEAAVQDAVVGGAWVMGPQVRQFEADLAAFGQAEHALGCGNGTDALILPLIAWSVRTGDAVFCPSFTFTATAEVGRGWAPRPCSWTSTPTPTIWIRPSSRRPLKRSRPKVA